MSIRVVMYLLSLVRPSPERTLEAALQMTKVKVSKPIGSYYSLHREELHAKYVAKHPPKVRKSLSPEEKKAKARARYLARYPKRHRRRFLTPEQRKERRRLYYQTHKEKKDAYAKEWAKTHRESRRESCRRWHTHQPKKPKRVPMTREQRNAREKARRAAWRLAHPSNRPTPSPEQVALRKRMQRRADKHRRKAAEKGAGGSYRPRDWKALCDSWGNRCLSCGSPDNPTTDHITPLALDGSNYLSNLQLLCMACNVRKGVSFIDFRPDHMLPSPADCV